MTIRELLAMAASSKDRVNFGDVLSRQRQRAYEFVQMVNERQIKEKEKGL